MIKLIVGLGNPGRQYEKTRHNAGFLFLDQLLVGSGSAWVDHSGFHALFSEYTCALGRVLLLKPQLFMNKSGVSVGNVVRYYKLLPEEVLVVHDELDFEVGVVRLKMGGGHAGHNGLRDIVIHLGSSDFCRLRMGIGRPAAGKVVADYVLSVPSKSEFYQLDNAFELGMGFMDKIIAGEFNYVMTKLNS